ncbi:MAG: pectin esterase, partial [Prevotellaceae bacterium]|nr:pectin esterase [Prevotellaceae bacterium]
MKNIFLSFLLLASVAATAQEYDIVVSQDGTGDFKAVQEAINSVRDYRPEGEVKIFIRKGIYKEKIVVSAQKTNITLIGEDVENTIITWDDHANINKMGTFKTYTILIYGNDFRAENITFENNAAQLGQAVAVHVEGDKVVFLNCRFLGNQDTVFTGNLNGREYFKNCYIEGTTDFIFGPATVFFDSCTIHCKRNSYITAASTPGEHRFGYVFKNCTVTAADNIGKVYLGRPWRAYAAVVFLSCYLGDFICQEGWHNWNDPEKERTARYAECENIGPG